MREFLRSRRAWLLGSIVIFVVAASACYQPAGSALESTTIAQGAPTFTDTPTITPLPTEAPTDTVMPTIEVSITPTVEAFSAESTQTPAEVALLPNLQEDPFAATATAFALSQSAALTQQAELLFDQDAGIDPLYLTATALVQQATQTFSVPLTQTAEAMFFPTATPTQQVIITDPIVPPGGNFQPGVDCIHEVRARDRNLFRISLAYGVTVESIAAASGLTNVNLIRVGDRLTIPGCGTTGFVPPPTSTPYATHLPGTQPPPITCTSPYTVRSGDTLYRISLACGVSVRDIANINSIVVPDLIFIGETLIIPGAPGGSG